MNEAVTVWNWKYNKSKINIKLIGITIASLFVALI